MMCDEVDGIGQLLIFLFLPPIKQGEGFYTPMQSMWYGRDDRRERTFSRPAVKKELDRLAGEKSK